MVEYDSLLRLLKDLFYLFAILCLLQKVVVSEGIDLLSTINFEFTNIYFQDGNLLAIWFGLLAIPVSLLIFIAGLKQSTRQKEMFYILLDKSRLKLLVATNTIFLMFILAIDIPFLSFIITACFSCFIFFSLMSIFKVLNNPLEYWKELNILLKKRIKNSLDTSKKKITKEEQFNNQISEEKHLQLSDPFKDYTDGQYYLFELDITGVLQNIDIENLKKFKEYALRHKKPQLQEAVVQNESTDTESTHCSEPLKNFEIIILKRLYNTLQGKETALLAIERSQLDERFVRVLKNKIEAIFEIDNEPDVEEQFLLEFSDITQQFLDDIARKRYVEIEHWLDLYKNLISFFNHNLDNSLPLNKNSFSYYTDFFKNETLSIIDQAILSDDQLAIRKCFYFPIKVIKSTIKEGKFIIWSLYTREVLLSLQSLITKRNISEDTKKKLRMNLSASIKILVRAIMSEEKNLNEDQINEHINLLLVIKNDLIKIALSDKDEQLCQLLLHETYRLQNLILDESIDSKTNQETVTKIQQLAFNLAAKFRDTDNTKYKQSRKIIDVDQGSLDRTYHQCMQRQTQDFWGWHIWNNSHDGWTSTFDTNIEELYLTLTLENIETGDIDGKYIIKAIQDPTEVMNLEKSIQKLQSSVRYIKVLEEIISNSIMHHQKKVSKKIISQPISDAEIHSFKSEVYESYKKQLRMREILGLHNKIVENTKSIESNDRRFGLSQIASKRIFSYDNWGESYAEGLARGEDYEIYTRLEKGCTLEKFSNFDRILKDTHLHNDYFIIAANIPDYIFNNLDSFESKLVSKDEKLDIQGFSGWVEQGDIKIPVFKIYNLKVKTRKVLLINGDKIKPLRQKFPENTNYEHIVIEVDAYSDEENGLLEETLKKPPGWLQEKGDVNAQEDHLKESVLIRIHEYFEFDDQSDIGYVFEVPDRHSNPDGENS